MSFASDVRLWVLVALILILLVLAVTRIMR